MAKRTTHTIDSYSGSYNSAYWGHSVIHLGDEVRVSEMPDGREWSDARATMAEGLELEWVRRMPRARLDVYRVVRAYH